MRRFRSATIVLLGSLASSGWGGVSGSAVLQQQSPYEDLISVLQGIRDAQAVFLESVLDTSDPKVIGEACDSLGARIEALTPPLHAALEAHPELQAAIPEGIQGTLDECRTAFQEWDDYVNATVLPMANGMPEEEALHTGFGRLNAAVFYMKYGRLVMTLGRGG